jgi:hypothetical protein
MEHEETLLEYCRAVARFVVDIGFFYNQVNDSLKMLCKALLDVQVGIGWVVPISKLDISRMKSFKQ